ncbi:hypothetical protein G3570_07235 [Balneolaceae bacterium YR4-1]|uniref:VWA domain-containing protein n=1 Tax=Halalkalibaculum roseum TaxID=2709311 RepID=A0A6M1SMZ8_9BACT|nr:hypothetical protein [Halalkalibaculum roseum]NGP76419.1 hypothetical protein [Halalkalibaculum roseum]
MDFIFQGFQSHLPIWLYLILFFLTTALSWWSYRDLRSTSPFVRYSLITLRSLVFLILLTLLVNPYYKAEQTRYEKPEIMVLWDNSESATIEKGSYNGRETYLDVIREIGISDTTLASYRLYSMGSAVEPSSLDSLPLNDSRTNIYNGIEAIKNQGDDISGAIMITDGIFNQGRNPAFEAGNISVPVMTVALGDTVDQKDLIVEEVRTNDTGYLETLHPLEARITTNGFTGRNFQVELRKGSEILQRQSISPAKNRTSHTLNFDINLQEEGLQQYEIVIPSVEGEWTATNNIQPFAIDVLNDKQRILSLAFEIHPDVKAVRSLLLEDENTRLIPRTWLGSDRFIEGDLDFSADTLELLILHGYPGRGLPAEVDTKVGNLLTEVPTIIIATPLSDFRSLQESNQNILPVSLGRYANAQTVRLLPDAEPTDHPIMELPEISYDLLPPLKAPVRSIVDATPGSTILFVSEFQGANTNQPLITIKELGNSRQSQLSGYNWHRLAQSSNRSIRQYWENLFYNIVSWTATKPDNRRLKVQPSQKVFTGTEPIILNAFLTNESGEKVTDGTVDVEFEGEGIETRFYSMTNIGDGQYQLTINALPMGIYRYEATAKKGNRIIDTQQGELSVSNTNTEFVNTERNDNLLKQISSRTGGSYFTFADLAAFNDSLNEKGMLSREEKVETTLFFPYQHSFWFILIITLLTAEWITRKYFALS